MCDLDDIKEKIRAAMESQGTYTEDLELCITLCAGSYMAFQIALNDISKKRMKSYVKEVSRETMINLRRILLSKFYSMHSKQRANNYANLV